MQDVIQFIVDHLYIILTILIPVTGSLVVYLRGKLRDIVNEVLVAAKLLRDAVDKKGPQGKDLSDKEQRLLAAQGVRIIEKAIGDRLSGWLRTLLGIKEPEEQQIYYNN